MALIPMVPSQLVFPMRLLTLGSIEVAGFTKALSVIAVVRKACGALFGCVTLSRLPAALKATLAAVTATLVHPSVLRRVLMALRAMGLSRMEGSRSLTAQDVLPVGDSFKVRWVATASMGTVPAEHTASSIVTGVVDGHTFWNGTNLPSITEAVNQRFVEAAVPVRRDIATPGPTAGKSYGGINLQPKMAFRVAPHGSHVHILPQEA